jgi:hypothetical protein
MKNFVVIVPVIAMTLTRHTADGSTAVTSFQYHLNYSAQLKPILSYFKHNLAGPSSRAF